VTEPDDVRPALERALEGNADGLPAVLSFAVEAFDYSPGFVSYPSATWQDDEAHTDTPANVS
jgi:hypothetical protein